MCEDCRYILPGTQLLIAQLVWLDYIHSVSLREAQQRIQPQTHSLDPANSAHRGTLLRIMCHQPPV